MMFKLYILQSVPSELVGPVQVNVSVLTLDTVKLYSYSISLTIIPSNIIHLGRVYFPGNWKQWKWKLEMENGNGKKKLGANEC